MNGIINIYKDAGMTSHDVVNRIRRIAGIKRVGHTGTLDPDAQGVLPVCIGKATRVCDMLISSDKRYTALLRLGITTDTQDIGGRVLNSRTVDVADEQISKAISEFKGDMYQTPPMYSAIKVKGKKLYEYAREGIEIKRAPRKITIYEINILAREENDIKLDIKCSKGTYIRTLCHDIGERLGCGGCMANLIRTQTSVFTLENAQRLETVEKFGIEKYLIPVDELFDYEKITVSGDKEKIILNGASAYVGADEGKYYRVYGSDGRFLCISKGLKGKLTLVKSFY